MIKAGNLIFVRDETFLSWIIRTITKSYYNHIAILISETEVLEALPNGVFITPLSSYEDREFSHKLEYRIFEVDGMTKEQVYKVIEFSKKEVGKKYDFLQLVSIYFFYLFGIPKKYEPIDVTEAWICSELVAEAFEYAGIKFSNDINSDNMTPKDILNSNLLK